MARMAERPPVLPYATPPPPEPPVPFRPWQSGALRMTLLNAIMIVGGRALWYSKAAAMLGVGLVFIGLVLGGITLFVGVIILPLPIRMDRRSLTLAVVLNAGLILAHLSSFALLPSPPTASFDFR
jgi:hypothetical protein